MDMTQTLDHLEAAITKRAEALADAAGDDFTRLGEEIVRLLDLGRFVATHPAVTGTTAHVYIHQDEAADTAQPDVTASIGAWAAGVKAAAAIAEAAPSDVAATPAADETVPATGAASAAAQPPAAPP